MKSLMVYCIHRCVLDGAEPGTGSRKSETKRNAKGEKPFPVGEWTVLEEQLSHERLLLCRWSSYGVFSTAMAHQNQILRRW